MADQEEIDERSALAEWLREFKHQRCALEALWAIDDNDTQVPSAQRKALIAEALALAPTPETPDLAEIESVAEHLEHSMQEALDKFNEDDSRERAIRNRLTIGQRDNLLALRGDQALRDERRWVFTGSMLEILHRFRDTSDGNGAALIKTDSKRLQRRLTNNIAALAQTLEELGSYLIVDRPIIHQLKVLTEDLDASSKQLIRESTDIEALLTNNGEHLRSQYLRLCMELCFEVYGLVTDPALQRLLDLKTAYHLMAPAGTVLTLNNRARNAASDRHIRRILHKAHDRITRRARTGKWAIQPLLQATGSRLRRIEAKQLTDIDGRDLSLSPWE